MENEYNYKNMKPLPYYGINKLLPYLRPYKSKIFAMVFLGLLGGLADIVFPLFQRYAINVFVGEGILDTFVGFVVAYVLVLVFQVIANSISA